MLPAIVFKDEDPPAKPCSQCRSFHVSLPTARLSSQALIALNTYTSSGKGPNGGKEGSTMGEAAELAARAWARLGGRSEDQAVLFL